MGPLISFPFIDPAACSSFKSKELINVEFSSLNVEASLTPAHPYIQRCFHPPPQSKPRMDVLFETQLL